jgi:hypothetical protein
MSRPVIWDFSSRGGELAKPDIVSPGTAISTVPDYVMNDRYNGTSMASPFTTGCCAVLVSAMQQQFPGYTPNAYLIKRALQMGAKPLPGYTPLDQGAGMINVPRAFEFLSGWHRKGTAPREYIVEAHMPGSKTKATSAYYRSGVFPQGEDRTEFHIKPLLPKQKPSREQMLSFNAYVLRSDAAWLEPIQSSIYRRGVGQLEVAVRYDEKQLTKPGLYVGKILAYPKASALGEQVPEFELWNTVVIPHRFDESNAYTVRIENFALIGSQLRREFFKIPPGIAALRFTLERRGEKDISATLFDNDGRAFTGFNISRDRLIATKMVTGEDFPGGVVELVLKSGLADDDERETAFSLTVDAIPLGTTITSASASEGEAKAIVMMQNAGVRPIDLDLSGSIAGYGRTIDTLIKGADEFRLPFEVHPGDDEVVFEVELSRKDYNLFTDMSLQVLSPDGEARVNNAFDERHCRVQMKVQAKDTAAYMLYFRGGLAVPGRGESFRLLIHERRVLEKGPELRCEPHVVDLAPSEADQIRLRSAVLPKKPNGYEFYGSLIGKLKGGDKIEVPLQF